MPPEKFKVYAKLCGEYVTQQVIMSALYDESRRLHGAPDEGCEAVLKCLQQHRLPRHIWPIPHGREMDDQIERLRWTISGLGEEIETLERELTEAEIER